MSNGKGTVTLAGAGLGPVAYLNSVSTSAVDIAGTVSLDKIPNAGGAYLGLVGRRNSGGEYRLKIRIGPDRSISVVTVRVSGGTETTLQSVNLAQQYTAGSTLNMRMQVSGVAPTTVRARVWSGGTEPTSWQLSSTDNLSGLQSAGSVGLHAYVSSAATNVGWVLRFDDFVARQI